MCAAWIFFKSFNYLQHYGYVGIAQGISFDLPRPIEVLLVVWESTVYEDL